MSQALNAIRSIYFFKRFQDVVVMVAMRHLVAAAADVDLSDFGKNKDFAAHAASVASEIEIPNETEATTATRATPATTASANPGPNGLRTSGIRWSVSELTLSTR